MEEEKVVENNESKIEEKKGFFKSKKNLLFFITLIIVVLLIGIGTVGYFTKFNFIFSNDKKADNSEKNQQQENEVVEMHGSLDIYCKYSGDDCWLTTSTSEVNRFFYKIETETSNPKY